MHHAASGAAAARPEPERPRSPAARFGRTAAAGLSLPLPTLALQGAFPFSGRTEGTLVFSSSLSGGVGAVGRPVPPRHRLE